jgi:hypothetical protein
VPLTTVIAPVDVFNEIPVGQVPLCEITELVKVEGTPFVESFERTFVIAIPPVAGTVPLSTIGLIIGVIITVSFTVLQLAGINLSHNWYVIEYTPGGVPLATEIAPVEVFNVIPVGHVPLCEIVELVNVEGTPFVESFERTFVIAMPPVAGTVPLSVIGIIAASTVIERAPTVGPVPHVPGGRLIIAEKLKVPTVRVKPVVSHVIGMIAVELSTYFTVTEVGRVGVVPANTETDDFITYAILRLTVILITFEIAVSAPVVVATLLK